MEEQLNPLERDHFLSVVLPGGMEKNTTVHGSKPVMDLLVTLCASYHLNPSDYTVEVLSPNKNNISFKANSPIGLLEAEKLVLKPRGAEEKIKKPYMPEATVRLLINYNKSHKAVVRVNPRVPLKMLLPVVCDKCEFKVETTILLRDSESQEPLDLTKTLNEHGLREVLARDTADQEPNDLRHRPDTPPAVFTLAEMISLQDLAKKVKKQKENTGFLSLFRRRKKQPDVEEAASAPSSPGVAKQTPVGVNDPSVSSADARPPDLPKKRRAPQPPLAASQSVPNNLSSCHLSGTQRSTESTLRSTKRRAPPPPCVNTQQELQSQDQIQVSVNSPNAQEDLRESNESDPPPSLSSSSSPRPPQMRSISLSSRPSFDPHLPSFRDRDLSEARAALAKVLTSSISKGSLVKRLRPLSTFPRFHNGSSFTPATVPDSEIEIFSPKPVSGPRLDLPTESEWEDPLQRRGMTTFKVVPLKKEKSYESELTMNIPEQYQLPEEENPETKDSPEDKEGSSSPDTEILSLSQEIQASDGPESPPTLQDPDQQDRTVPEDSDKDEDKAEQTEVEASEHNDEEAVADAEISSVDPSERPQSPSGQLVYEEMEPDDEDNEDVFPPPPPPVFFDDDIEVAEEVQEDANVSSHLSSPAHNSQHQQDETPQHKAISAPSRFAQAVALAVQRSRLHSLGKAFSPQSSGGRHGSLPSPLRSTYQYGA